MEQVPKENVRNKTKMAKQLRMVSYTEIISAVEYMALLKIL